MAVTALGVVARPPSKTFSENSHGSSTWMQFPHLSLTNTRPEASWTQTERTCLPPPLAIACQVESFLKKSSWYHTAMANGTVKKDVPTALASIEA